MTEEEVINQINTVVNRIASKYTFYGYEVDDIRQEAFIICMDALERYDNKRPLENFLSVHLSNRLKNFIRDNYFTKDEEEKKKVMKPKSLSSEDFSPLNKDRRSKDEFIDAKDMQAIVDAHLPASYRADYLKIVNDVYVPKKRREEVIATIKDIVERYINEEG